MLSSNSFEFVFHKQFEKDKEGRPTSGVYPKVERYNNLEISEVNARFLEEAQGFKKQMQKLGQSITYEVVKKCFETEKTENKSEAKVKNLNSLAWS